MLLRGVTGEWRNSKVDSLRLSRRQTATREKPHLSFRRNKREILRRLQYLIPDQILTPFQERYSGFHLRRIASQCLALPRTPISCCRRTT